MSQSLVAKGTDEEKQFLKSCLVDSWLATCEYKHCQEMVSKGDLKEIKEFIKGINNSGVIDVWLRSTISHQKAEVFKMIAKDIDLSLERIPPPSRVAGQANVLIS